MRRGDDTAASERESSMQLRLKNWRVLRDHRRRGRHLQATIDAVAVLHNLQVELRDKS